MKRRSPLLFGLALMACAPASTTRVVAAEGGWVRSADDRFALFFPPGALDADLDISIEPLPEGDWEVDAPRRFSRVSDVYRVAPRVALARDVYAVMELDAAPPVLRAPSGDGVLAVHYVYDGDKVRPAPFTRTVYFADGRVGIVATLFDLGDHWFAERAPAAELVQLSARVEAPAPAGAQWSWSRGALFADHPLPILGSEVRVAATGEGAVAVAPVAEGGAERTWDARWDEDLGLHPAVLFGGADDARSERVVRVSDPMPFVLDAAAPRDPLLDPLPGWRCEAAGEATLYGGVDVVSGASSGTTTTGVLVELGHATCP